MKPYYEILQILNVFLVRDGGAYKWKKSGNLDNARLKKILDNE